MEPDVAGVLSQFKSIKRHANQLYPDPIDSMVESLVEEFDNAKMDFETIRRRQNIDIYIRDIYEVPIYPVEVLALLQTIDIECDKAIGALESIATPLPKEDLDKLTTLREDLKKLAEVLDITYERNLNGAINEYEKGHYLASALISGRVIIYALDQIPGESSREKVEFLIEKEIIEKSRKDVQESIIKANRRARAFFTHDIKVSPETSEALSLLGDTIGILRIVSKL